MNVENKIGSNKRTWTRKISSLANVLGTASLGAACVTSVRLALRWASDSSQHRDLVLAQVLEVVARGWSLRLLEIAGGLGWKRPSPSAKVVDVKCRRLVECVGNHKRLGKNGRRFWHNSMEGKRPFASKLPGNSHRPTRPSQAASA